MVHDVMALLKIVLLTINKHYLKGLIILTHYFTVIFNTATACFKQTNYMRVLEINVVRVLFDRDTLSNPLLLFLDKWFGWIWPKSFTASRTLEDPAAHKLQVKTKKQD
jgi:hypothetical protein